jgi:hypothetical protein
MAVTHLLDLAPERIRLLRRSGGVVDILGEIPTDAADLTPRLKALVAGGDRPLAAALVLPESQILYTRLPAPGPDDAARAAQVRAALDGRTPYALDEIAFDWSADGDEAFVAAIALETLDEAARFASAHGIDVRGYLAQPEADLFPREAVFLGEAVLDAAPEEEDPADAQVEPEGTAAAGVQDLPAGESPATVTPAAGTPEAVTPTAAPMVFTAMRALPDAQTLAARLAATSARFRPSEPPLSTAPVPADMTARDIPAAAERTPAHPDPTVTPAASVTADWLPDAPAATLPKPAPLPQRAPAPAANATRRTERPQVSPADPRRRLALAALVAILLIAGGWTLLATFGPRSPAESMLTLPAGTEIPETDLAAFDPAAFAPTVEELDEGFDADVADTPAPVAQAGRRPFVDVPPIAGRLFSLRDDSWRTDPAAPALPAIGTDFDIEIAAIDPVTVSTDAFAMPPFGAADRLPGADSAAVAAAEDAVPPGGVALEIADGDGVDAGAPGDPGAAGAADGTLQPTALAAALTDDFRPRVRPEGLVEEAERARFNGLTLNDLAEVRPSERPASPQADPSINPEATAQAVQRSPLPQTRPANMEELVAAARAEPEPTPVAEAEPELSADPPEGVAAASTASEGVETARAPEPEAPAATTDEEPEPEVVAAAPSLPTRAEVAREATVKNAIRLGQINLIGVYGTPSDRRALIRLSSGRFVKVKVGDRVDGGQVAQIGDNSLRYVKSGREHTLVVPSS